MDATRAAITKVADWALGVVHEKLPILVEQSDKDSMIQVFTNSKEEAIELVTEWHLNMMLPVENNDSAQFEMWLESFKDRTVNNLLACMMIKHIVSSAASCAPFVALYSNSIYKKASVNLMISAEMSKLEVLNAQDVK